MKILIINTPDGPMYWRGDRVASRRRAITAAVGFVLDSYERYDSEDKETVGNSTVRGKTQEDTFKALIAVGAIEEVELYE
jgi:hypothetical protein